MDDRPQKLERSVAEKLDALMGIDTDDWRTFAAEARISPEQFEKMRDVADDEEMRLLREAVHEYRSEVLAAGKQRGFGISKQNELWEHWKHKPVLPRGANTKEFLTGFFDPAL